MTAPVQTRTTREAAAMLGMSYDWLKLNRHRFPHMRMGRRAFFTDAHLAAIQAMCEVTPQVPQNGDGVRRRRQLGGAA